MASSFCVVPDPSLLFTSSNRGLTAYSEIPKMFAPVRKYMGTTILRATNKRRRYVLGRSSWIMLESAVTIASKLGLLPAPVESILKEFGGGNGRGSGSWKGFGWGGGSDGWRRRKGRKLGVFGMLVLIFGVSLWLIAGRDVVVDADVLLGGLGLVLFGLSVDGWRKGAKDWILGFCFCAFLMVLVFKREDFRIWVQSLGTQKKNGRRKSKGILWGRTKSKGILRFT